MYLPKTYMYVTEYVKLWEEIDLHFNCGSHSLGLSYEITPTHYLVTTDKYKKIHIILLSLTTG